MSDSIRTESKSNLESQAQLLQMLVQNIEDAYKNGLPQSGR